MSSGTGSLTWATDPQSRHWSGRYAAYRWTEENQDNPRPDGLPRRPCPFDNHLRPTPAFYAIEDAFAPVPKRNPSWLPPRGSTGGRGGVAELVGA